MSHDSEGHVGDHPKGTLAILLIYGALFVVGWLAMYFGIFVPRGPIGG